MADSIELQIALQKESHHKGAIMWYFNWILGLGLAVTFGVLNAIWYEILERPEEQQAHSLHE